MSWNQFNTDYVLSEFTLAEAAALRQTQGSGSGSGQPFTSLNDIVARTIEEVRGYILSGNYDVDSISNTLPAGLFNDAIAIARWRYLISNPSFRQLQTEERRTAFEDAIKKLNLIAQQNFAVEPPTPDTNPRSGNWNSENKLIMRTHPVPRPGVQFDPQDNTYANPDAPADTPLDP